MRRGGLLRSLVVASAFFWAWCAFWKARHGPDPLPDEVRWAQASDGWRLALSRYRPQAKARRHPVVLCHGLGANRLSWDPGGGGPSLARWLSARGFDVWVLELRGHGLSERPSLFGGRGWGWSFDDYLRKDLPAALDFVRAETGREPHYIGHSMGGDLLLAWLGSGGGRLRTGTAVGSSIDNAGLGSAFDRLLPIRWLTRVLPALPMGPLALAGSPFAGRFDTGLDRFGVWQANIDPALFRRFLARGLHPVSAPVLAQLSTAFEPGGLRSADGAHRYMEGLGSSRTPLLDVAGDKDAQCPPAAARRSFEAAGAQDKRFVVFGKEGGQPEHYGHMDLLLGLRAEKEVYPVLADWLIKHD